VDPPHPKEEGPTSMKNVRILDFLDAGEGRLGKKRNGFPLFSSPREAACNEAARGGKKKRARGRGVFATSSCQKRGNHEKP